jgi:NAD-dependent DNA ligase
MAQRDYTMHVSKDEHGQTRHLFRALAENNVSKAIDQLSGICAGILADGKVCDTEARFFNDWVRKFSSSEPIWPFTDILSRLNAIFNDGVIDEEERSELAELMKQIIGRELDDDPTQSHSSALPLNDPAPNPVKFSGNEFVLTGRFAFGTRQKVTAAILALGGTVKDGFPMLTTHYLIIGAFASRDWYNTNYGRKIERGVEIRSNGHPISIVSEEHWKNFLT